MKIVRNSVPTIRNINLKLAGENLIFVIFFCENGISVKFYLMLEFARSFVHHLFNLDALKLAENCFELNFVVVLRNSICSINSQHSLLVQWIENCKKCIAEFFKVCSSMNLLYEFIGLLKYFQYLLKPIHEPCSFH